MKPTSSPFSTMPAASTATVLQNVTFTAAANSSSAVYQWNFGDGIFAAGPSVVQAFPAEGLF